jgi:two-component system, NtrC family, sensor histidine kinase HydH
MENVPCRPGPVGAAERGRVEVFRHKIFEEMGRGSHRWRLTWLLPFHVLLVTLLVMWGEARWRAVVQIIAAVVFGSLTIARVFDGGRRLKAVAFLLGVCGNLALVATTGGLASPLLPTSMLLIVVAGTIMREPPWLPVASFAVLLTGFVSFALLAHTPIGQVAAPLRPGPTGPSAEYVSLAALAVVFTMIGVGRVGQGLTRAYERAAIELAERRDELCSENVARSRALDGMAARLAHEVKNPLAAIKGLSTHMARQASDPKAAERLAIVAAEADRLQSIVDGFLSFSRGFDDLRPAPTRPFEVARELAVLLETRVEEAEVTLAVTGDQDLVLDADARKLRQALLNVVLNAVEASPRGSTVSVNVQRDCDGARIVVRDAGVGMTPEVLDRIRKPYFTTKEGGSGLGLAVARGLVEQHGGALEFKSVANKGTTVTISLPTKAKPSCSRLPDPRRMGSEVEAAVETAAPAPAGVR